jgi:hypothetical protein
MAFIHFACTSSSLRYSFMLYVLPLVDLCLSNKFDDGLDLNGVAGISLGIVA